MLWYNANGSFVGGTGVATSASFSFGNDGRYTSIHNGASGAVGAMNTFQQEYKGNYEVTGPWNVRCTNRYQGKAASFEASFRAVRNGRLLLLNDHAGQRYNLVRVK